MTVKEIIEFPVDDEEFKAFQAAFEKFQGRLAKLPDAFKEVGKESKGSAESFKQMTAALLAQNELSRKVAKNTEDVNVASRQAAFSWSRIARDSKTVAGNIVGATTSLLKWTGIATIFGGLLGAFGFDHLAASAGAGRKSAIGLGVTYGQQQAFGTTFGRVVDPGSFLGGISQGVGDISSEQAGSLFRLGINPLTSGGTGKTSIAALKKIYELAQGTDESQLGILAQTRGTGSFGVGVQELRNFKSMSQQDFDKYIGDYERRTQTLGVTDPALKKMQDFDVALDEAEKKIKSVLIEGLANLGGPLGELANAFADMVKTLLGSAGFKEIIKDVTEGLQTFSKYINTEKFQTDLHSFVDGIAYAAEKITDGLRFLGLIPDNKPSALSQYPVIAGGSQAASDTMGKWMQGLRSYLGIGPQTPNPVDNIVNGILSKTSASSGLSNNLSNDELLALTTKLEGSPTINGKMAIGKAGEVGPHQIMDTTAIGLGYTPNDRYDPVKNEQMARKLIQQASDRYGGDTAKILADYNGGPRAVKLYEQGGTAALRNNGYGGTADYIDRAGGIKVTIENNTGGAVVPTVTQMGLPQPAIGVLQK